MSKFSDKIRNEYGVTREDKEDELEEKMLKARIENSIRKLEQEMYINILAEKDIVENIVKDYEKLRYYQTDEEFDHEEYEFQKRRLQKLTTKKIELSRKMHQDPSWEEFQEEELKGEEIEK